MLGLYTPVIMLISIISILPNSLGAYMYPKFTFQMAQSRDLNGIWKKLIRIYAASFVFILLSSLVGYYLLDYFVYLFPKYALSKEYLKLSLLLCPFVFFRMGNTLHIVLKKYNYMVLFTLIYGLAQLISLKVLSLYYIDIIEIVIWSQIYTSILVFIVGLGLNYRLLHLHRNSMDLWYKSIIGYIIRTSPLRPEHSGWQIILSRYIVSHWYHHFLVCFRNPWYCISCCFWYS